MKREVQNLIRACRRAMPLSGALGAQAIESLSEALEASEQRAEDLQQNYERLSALQDETMALAVKLQQDNAHLHRLLLLSRPMGHA